MNKQYDFTVITMPDETTTKSGLPFAPLTKQRVSMSSTDLEKKLSEFLQSFGDVLEKQPESIGNGLKLDEIEINLSINASGGIELIGKAEVGVQSAIKLKFKRGQT